VARHRVRMCHVPRRGQRRQLHRPGHRVGRCRSRRRVEGGLRAGRELAGRLRA
jgi:hypothetical protein